MCSLGSGGGWRWVVRWGLVGGGGGVETGMQDDIKDVVA